MIALSTPAAVAVGWVAAAIVVVFTPDLVAHVLDGRNRRAHERAQAHERLAGRTTGLEERPGGSPAHARRSSNLPRHPRKAGR